MEDPQLQEIVRRSHTADLRDTFSALIEWAKGDIARFTAAEEARRETARLARNEKARVRYAQMKALGTNLRREAKAEEEPEYQLTGCVCAVTGYPPCSWCVSQGDGE